jgi:peptidoglycan/xylan/chitin deacetylase (PgdA/CDA1 family)
METSSPSVIPRVAVTFDDGYADVVINALPILEKYQVPATIFIVVDAINSSAEFWWDQLEQILLNTQNLPSQLTISTDYGVFQKDLKECQNYTTRQQAEDREIEVFESEPSTRLHLFKEVWEHLCFMSADQQQVALSQLWHWSGHSQPVARSTHRALNDQELQELASNPLIEIGAHTMSHARLPALTLEQQKAEIENSINALEKMLSAKIRSFSYPYGQHDEHSVNLVSEAGIERAVITRPGVIAKLHSPLRLNRFTVGNWTGQDLKWNMRSWLNSLP